MSNFVFDFSVIRFDRLKLCNYFFGQIVHFFFFFSVNGFFYRIVRAVLELLCNGCSSSKMLCFALLCFALLCFALLCFTLLRSVSLDDSFSLFYFEYLISNVKINIVFLIEFLYNACDRSFPEILYFVCFTTGTDSVKGALHR